LKNLNNWCCYRLIERNGKTTKIPVNPHDGGGGKSNDETTWSSFDVAMNAVEKYNCDGLGFYFKKPYFGIDLDGVKEEINRFWRGDHENNIVSDFINTMESYAETSVSGTGIHIIAKGALPVGGRRKNNVEMYDSGRFFVMTGNKISKYTEILEDEHGKIAYLHDKYIGSKPQQFVKQNAHEQNVKHNAYEQPVKNNAHETSDLSTSDIIRCASNSKNGHRFKMFMQGGWEQVYDSQSEADLAFCNDLAFWCGRDFNKMDDIFRSSSLYREKWDKLHGDLTYGSITLYKAINDCQECFTPHKNNDKNDDRFFSYDDTGNAERLVEKFGDVLKYSYTNKCWYTYDKKVWRRDLEGSAHKLVDKAVEEMKYEKIFIPDGTDEKEAQKLFSRHVKKSRSHNAKTAMLNCAKPMLSIKPEIFDNDITLLNLQNGYLDLETLALNPHDRDKYFLKISNATFSENATCPRWDKFLSEIFDNNQELISFIKKAVGYTLTGSTIEQVMFILYGDGRNGKSVFLDIIGEIMGDYAQHVQPQTIMNKKFASNSSSDLARIDGARFVTTTESNYGSKLDEGLVKQLTGGDKVAARRLYENEIEFIPQFKLWMATNHKPVIRGNDAGVWRRIALIPFKVEIPKNAVDIHLKDKLRDELPGILNWALEGLAEWRIHRLVFPEIIQTETENYKIEMDVIESFIEDCCERVFLKRTQASTLYASYRSWALHNNQYLMSSTKFGVEMGKKFKKVRSNGIYYEGIILKRNDNTSFKISY
jgi:putative DNA primase/helicase